MINLFIYFNNNFERINIALINFINFNNINRL